LSYLTLTAQTQGAALITAELAVKTVIAGVFFIFACIHSVAAGNCYSK
jgi:hypothetical protein